MSRWQRFKEQVVDDYLLDLSTPPQAWITRAFASLWESAVGKVIISLTTLAGVGGVVVPEATDTTGELKSSD